MAQKKRAKKAKAKTQTTSQTKSPSSRRIPYLLIGIALAFLIIVAIVAYYRSPTAPGDIAASVNGEPITQSWLDFQYGLLPQEYQDQLTREEALEQIINEELIIQAAAKEGVAVTDADVNERVQNIISQNELTIADLEKNLAAVNVTIEQFEALIRRQLTISAYTEQKIVIEEPTEQELRDLYALSQSAFAVPQQATVRHVLVSSQRTNAASIAKSIFDAVRDGADICAFVENSTDDRGSRETCGEYTFQKGVMVPEFETASFELKPGEVKLVQSQFGYHIIKKIADVPAGVQPFEDVEDLLRDQYMGAQRAQQYQALISGLRDTATIVYGGESEGMYTPPVEASAPDEPSAPETLDEPEMPAEDVPAPQVPAADLKACIADRATLYGTEWSADTQDAREMFEGYDLTYVSCDGGCDGIAGYPTWKVGKAQLAGRASVEQLAELAGC